MVVNSACVKVKVYTMKKCEYKGFRERHVYLQKHKNGRNIFAELIF